MKFEECSKCRCNSCADIYCEINSCYKECIKYNEANPVYECYDYEKILD